MRLATLVLLAMFAVLQYTLWLGKGGWLRIWSLERDIEVQSARQTQLREANAVGHAEVEDLRAGLEAVEERARREIGMLRADETFFQYPAVAGAPAPAAPATNNPSVAPTAAARPGPATDPPKAPADVRSR